MSLSDIAIRRPITTFMFFIAVVLIGAFSLSQLAIDLLPDIEFPTVTVSVPYPGASPKEVETLITEHLERAVSTVQNVEEVRATSSEGMATVRVSFGWGIDMMEAINDIRERIARIKQVLPEETEEPRIWKFDTSRIGILYLGLSGNLPLDKIRRYAEDEIQYKLEQIKGVAAVDIRGGLEREIHVSVDRSQLEAVGLSFSQVVSALRRENLDMPGGYLETDQKELLLRTSGQYTSISQIVNTVVGHQSGTPIYLFQIAEVSDSFKERRDDTRIQGKPGISLAIRKQPGENTVQVADRVLRRVESIKRVLPVGMEISVLWDTSAFIRDSMSQIQQTGALGGILAVCILFIFLQNLRSTLIISVAIPTAVIATFIMMDSANLTLNMMSMGGIALGLGMLLDNAIVVLENIFRHRQAGKSANEAASIGTKEVSAAIVASTLTTLCVFLPLFFAGTGMQGIFFRQLAYTVCFALLASLVVALTLIPVMSAKFLRVNSNSPSSIPPPSGGRTQVGGRFRQRITGGFEGLNNKYRDGLDWALRHRVWVVVISLFVLGLTLTLMPKLGAELMPDVDEGDIAISVQLPVGTKFEATDAIVRQLETVVQQEVPEILSLRTNVGAGSGWRSASGTHAANLRIRLVDGDERTRSTNEVVAHLRKVLSGVPDVRIWISSRGSLITRLLSRGGRQDRIEVEVRGHDLQRGQRLAERVKELVEGVEGTENVRVSREEGKPELTVHVDRDKAYALALDLSTIADTLNTGLTGKIATQYREDGDEFDVRVRLKETDRLSLDSVKTVFVRTGMDSAVVLSNIAHIAEREGPINIDRRNQERVITVSAGFSNRDFGGIAEEITQKLVGFDVPEGFVVQFAGEQEEQQEAYRNLMIVLLLAVALVYMVMASQFESLLHPFVIMFSIPFAAIGVILILFLTGTNVSIPTYIGIIMLVGIVVNNAIVLVDYINLLRKQGLEMREAILEGGRRRLRPILMTTLTTAFALMPMSLGLGAGAEMQAPMARVVVGGLTIAMVFTLFFIPTVYSLFESAREKLRREV